MMKPINKSQKLTEINFNYARKKQQKKNNTKCFEHTQRRNENVIFVKILIVIKSNINNISKIYKKKQKNC